jgi:beta-galactosidase
VAESILATTGDPVRLKLTSDRTVLGADGQDLAFVTVEAVDEKGRLQTNSNQKVRFAVSGVGTLAAVGNGDGQSMDPYSGDTYRLFHGRALAVLRTSRHTGKIKLTATADSLSASSIFVESRQPKSLAGLR